MKWDIFYNRNGRKKGPEKDAMDLMIAKIEKFAPGKYRSERYLYYYNYRSMVSYIKPLMALLEIVVKWNQHGDQRAELLRGLFVRLKDFYDPRGRLSMSEALEDVALMRKLQELFLLFHNNRDAPAAAEIKELLH